MPPLIQKADNNKILSLNFRTSMSELAITMVKIIS